MCNLNNANEAIALIQCLWGIAKEIDGMSQNPQQTVVHHHHHHHHHYPEPSRSTRSKTASSLTGSPGHEVDRALKGALKGLLNA